MPKIAEIETTPNPNARKFVLREPLTGGVTRSFESAAQARTDALAAALFAIPHVTNVFYVDRWLTVTQDGGADWQDLIRKLAEPVRAAAAYNPAAPGPVGAARVPVAGSPADESRLRAINALLDERVRPALRRDGGDILIVSLVGNQLTIHYQGACGTCPSAITGTLAGIEGLLHAIEPDMQIVAV
ncbi:MAG: NifU family protein [Gammaproteobacteria bacterium]|nr:NifU family protein [Gammaproteobacteria bacterium]